MWSALYWGDDIAAFKGAETEVRHDPAGSRDLRGIREAWAPQAMTRHPAPYFNNVQKVVVTKTLKDLEWKTRTAAGRHGVRRQGAGSRRRQGHLRARQRTLARSMLLRAG